MTGSLYFRKARIADAPALAALTLEARMAPPETARGRSPASSIQPGQAAEIARYLGSCLSEGFDGVVFCDGSSLVGFALFRRYPDHIHLTRFVVAPGHRAAGAGVEAFQWLWENEWADSPMVRREVGRY